MDEKNKLKAQWEQQEEDQINAAIEALLAAPNGRRTLWWLLRIGKVGLQPFNGNALGTSFNCGELNVGNQILSRITSVSPDGYLTMLKEMADERRSRDEQLRNLDERGDDRDGDGDLFGYDRD